ncbi:MAG: cobalamin biosynthesis protein CobD, partial [Dehalococcoidia bacterium]|nr:cobalamin biosynthesis protein CobD [Dehalococcoidia bacterium]
MIGRRITVVLAALALDAALGELPNRYHPVARLGRGAALFDRMAPHSGRRSAPAAGVGLLAAALATAIGAGQLGRRCSDTLPGWLSVPVEAALLKQAFAARALFAHAEAVRGRLATGAVSAARSAAARMVSRDTGALDEALLASAAIESVAENLSDSVVAPLGWYLLAGLDAAFAYRAVNTLDAMVGYRARGWFGTPAARLDDLLNFVPARLTALLIACSSGTPLVAVSGAWSDHAATPSPNSGWPMAAMAHGLGVRLEKRGHHVLNARGRRPRPADITRANQAGVLALGAGLLLTGEPFTQGDAHGAGSPRWRHGCGAPGGRGAGNR